MQNKKILNVVFVVVALIFLIGAVSAANNHTDLTVKNKSDNDIISVNDSVNENSNVNSGHINNIDEKNNNPNETIIPSVTINFTPIKVHVDLDNQKTTCVTRIHWKCDSDLLYDFKFLIKDEKGEKYIFTGKQGGFTKQLDCDKTYDLIKKYVYESGTVHYEKEKIRFDQFKNQIPLSWNAEISDDSSHVATQNWKILTSEGKKISTSYLPDILRFGPTKNHFLNYTYKYNNITYLFTKTISFSKEILTNVSVSVKRNSNSIHFDINTNNKNITGVFGYRVMEHHIDRVFGSYERLIIMPIWGDTIEINEGIVNYETPNIFNWNDFEYDYELWLIDDNYGFYNSGILKIRGELVEYY